MQKIKDYLQNTQPIVYQVLKNAFSQHKTTHAYLINGPKGSYILPVAELMAQSFVCQHKDEDHLACEECLDCTKIKDKNYIDYIFLEGENLKNDQVLNLQKEFNKSAVEKQNVKIYIIHLIEKAPIASLNKLLKFIEEPSSNIIAIFTTHSLSSILPTITSRCQIIHLKQFGHQELVTKMMQENIKEEDAHLLALVSNDLMANLELVQSQTYQQVLDILKQSLSYWNDNPNFFIYYMQKEGFPLLEKNNQIEFYLDCLEACFFETMLTKHQQQQPRFLSDIILKMQQNDANMQQKIMIIMIAKQELLSNANKMLVLDKLLIQLTDGDENE